MKRVNGGALRGSRTPKGDPIALERADQHHWLLEKAIVDLCAASGITALTNTRVDLLAQASSVSIIFEVKACIPAEAGRRVRQAIYQLLEYRFLYRNRLASDVRLCVVSEHRPSGGVEWLVEYMEHLGIGIIWKSDDNDGLICSGFTKALLIDVLPQVGEWPPPPIQSK